MTANTFSRPFIWLPGEDKPRNQPTIQQIQSREEVVRKKGVEGQESRFRVL